MAKGKEEGEEVTAPVTGIRRTVAVTCFWLTIVVGCITYLFVAAGFLCLLLSPRIGTRPGLLLMAIAAACCALTVTCRIVMKVAMRQSRQLSSSASFP